MKFILTVHQFFPEYSSGTEVLTFSVARELVRRGHEVYVLTGYPARTSLPDSRRLDRYEIEGVQVYRFHHGFTPMGGQLTVSEIEYNNHLVARYFAGIVDEVGPDVVHFFHFSRLSAALVDVVRSRNIPAFYTPTDFWAVCPTSQLLLGEGVVCDGPSSQGGNCVKHVAALTRWRHYSGLVRHLPDAAFDAVARLARTVPAIRFPFHKEIAALGGRKGFIIPRLNALQGIVSPTRLMTDVLVRNGVRAELIVQSAYGIDTAGFDDAKPRQATGSGVTFGYIGTLAPHKGCHVLIEAFRQLNRGDSRLKVYGNPAEFPDYSAELRTKAEACGGAIEFCGTFPNGRIAEVLAGIDVLVVPSVWYENTPLVVYSALAAKCPVIASDFPGMSEVIRHEWNGLLFAPGRADELAERLRRMKDEPELRGGLSANCQPPKSTTRYVDELLALYRQAPGAPRHELPGLQKFDRFMPAKAAGYLTGWATASGGAPRAVRVVDGGREFGIATEFLSRPDVREGLRKSGMRISTAGVGFAISLETSPDRSSAVLEVEDQQGCRHGLRIAELNVGRPASLGDGIVVGLDQLEFSTGGTQDTDK